MTAKRIDGKAAAHLAVVDLQRLDLGSTLGDAGVLLPAGDEPVLLAEAVREVLDNGGLRQSLVGKGRERLKQFEPDVARAAFAEQLLAVL